MEGFSVSVDLSSFFSDLRSKSLIYVDTTNMKTIAHVENHIKTLFDVDVDICLFSNMFFLPSMEDVRVLINCDAIKVEPGQPGPGNDQDDGTGSRSRSQELEQMCRNVQHKPKPSDPNEGGNLPDRSRQHDNLAFPNKKKHKKRRVLDSQNPSHVSENLPGEVEVKKIKSSKSSSTFHISKESEENARGAREKSVSLNGTTTTLIFSFDKQPGSKYVIESPLSQKGKTYSLEGSSMLCDAPPVEDKTESLSGTPSSNHFGPLESDVDSISQPPRKGHKRKRKRPNKSKCEELTTPAAPVEAPITVSPKLLQPNYWISQPLVKKTKHIYFSDVDQPMCEEIKEKLIGEDTVEKESVETVAETTYENVEKLSGETALEKSSSQGTIEEAAWQEIAEKKGTVELSSSRNCSVAKNQIPSWSQRRPYLDKASGGIGKLLAMLKSDSPSVYERPKAVTPNETVWTNTASGTSNCDGPVQSVGFPCGDSAKPSAARPCSPGSTTDKNGTPPKFIPKANSRISFKILKMSPSYCPEVSATIIAVVEKVTPESERVTLRLISGADECIEPRGKFDLDESERVDRVLPETIQLKWEELIEPTEC